MKRFFYSRLFEAICQLFQKPLTLSLLFFFLLTATFAQIREPYLYFPSPTAAELGNYGNTPVSTFTGTAEISVPLYELKTKNLMVPIQLNYRTNGLLANKAASNVGFDWSLSCGGYITRTVRGLPDDGEQTRRKKFPVNLDGFSLNTLTAGERTQIANYLIGWDDGCDTEPDMLTFNVNGYSGQFYVDHDDKVVLVPHQKIEIEFPQKYNTFNITTPDGIRYVFAASEYAGLLMNSSATHYTLVKIVHPQGDEIRFY